MEGLISYLDFPLLGKCKITIDADDSNKIPYFSIKKEEDNLEIKIEIFSPNYLDNPEYKLNKDQKEFLNEFLKANIIDHPMKEYINTGLSVWHFMVGFWDSTIELEMDDESIIMPDYNQLE